MPLRRRSPAIERMLPTREARAFAAWGAGAYGVVTATLLVLALRRRTAHARLHRGDVRHELERLPLIERHAPRLRAGRPALGSDAPDEHEALAAAENVDVQELAALAGDADLGVQRARRALCARGADEGEEKERREGCCAHRRIVTRVGPRVRAPTT